MEQTKPTRLIVGITGATGTIFGVRLLQMLHGAITIPSVTNDPLEIAAPWAPIP